MNFKLEKNFTSELIEGETYILPYGQNIAMHKKGVRLNPTGEFLWSLMEKTEDYSEILQSFYRHYDAADGKERQMLKKDFDDFLLNLKAHSIIRDLDEEAFAFSGEKILFSIGGIGIACFIPKDYLHENLLDFQSEEEEKHSISVYLKSFQNQQLLDGEVLVRTEELIILKKENLLVFDYKTNQIVKELCFDIVTKQVDIRMLPGKDVEVAKEEIFFAIRNAFLYYAARHHRFAVHSASLEYRDKVWLFSGHSGAGKSTHTNLWKEMYKVSDFNGDLNLVGVEEGRAYAYGLPWCGTSGIYSTGKKPLGGIVFLSQGEKDELLPLSKSEKPLYLMQRMISPAWTKEQLERNLDAARHLVDAGIGVWKLSCTKNKSAAEYMKKELDQWNS